MSYFLFQDPIQDPTFHLADMSAYVPLGYDGFLYFNDLDSFEEYWSSSCRLPLNWGHCLTSSSWLDLGDGFWEEDTGIKYHSHHIISSIYHFSDEETESQRTGPAQASRKLWYQFESSSAWSSSPCSLHSMTSPSLRWWGKTRLERDNQVAERWTPPSNCHLFLCNAPSPSILLV